MLPYITPYTTPLRILDYSSYSARSAKHEGVTGARIPDAPCFTCPHSKDLLIEDSFWGGSVWEQLQGPHEVCNVRLEGYDSDSPYSWFLVVNMERILYCRVYMGIIFSYFLLRASKSCALRSELSATSLSLTLHRSNLLTIADAIVVHPLRLYLAHSAIGRIKDFLHKHINSIPQKAQRIPNIDPV